MDRSLRGLDPVKLTPDTGPEEEEVALGKLQKKEIVYNEKMGNRYSRTGCNVPI